MGTSVYERAQMTEPADITSSSTSSIRRLPNMSPRRPAMGVAMAAARRVEVSTHEASAMVVSR